MGVTKFPLYIVYGSNISEHFLPRYLYVLLDLLHVQVMYTTARYHVALADNSAKQLVVYRFVPKFADDKMLTVLMNLLYLHQTNPNLTGVRKLRKYR